MEEYHLALTGGGVRELLRDSGVEHPQDVKDIVRIAILATDFALHDKIIDHAKKFLELHHSAVKEKMEATDRHGIFWKGHLVADGYINDLLESPRTSVRQKTLALVLALVIKQADLSYFSLGTATAKLWNRRVQSEFNFDWYLGTAKKDLKITPLGFMAPNGEYLKSTWTFFVEKPLGTVKVLKEFLDAIQPIGYNHNPQRRVLNQIQTNKEKLVTNLERFTGLADIDIATMAYSVYGVDQANVIKCVHSPENCEPEA
eukprot:jgi/Bigna1/145492/aug1.99_g20200